MRVFALILMALLLSGCLPEDKEKATGAYKLYSAKCSSCHRLLPLEEHPLEKWEEYVEKYGKALTPEERTLLLDFIKKYKETK